MPSDDITGPVGRFAGAARKSIQAPQSPEWVGGLARSHQCRRLVIGVPDGRSARISSSSTVAGMAGAPVGAARESFEVVHAGPVRVFQTLVGQQHFARCIFKHCVYGMFAGGRDAAMRYA